MADDQNVPTPAETPVNKVPSPPVVEDGELSDEELGTVSGGASNIGAVGRPSLRDRLP